MRFLKSHILHVKKPHVTPEPQVNDPWYIRYLYIVQDLGPPCFSVFGVH